MKQLNSEIVIILPSEMKDCPVRVVEGLTWKNCL